MKLLQVLVSVVIIATSVHEAAATSSALIKMFSTTCQIKEKASDQDVDNLSNGIVPETPEGKCLSACMGKRFGLIKDGKLSKDGFMNIIALKIGDDEAENSKAGKVAEACLGLTDKNRCESAFIIWKCVESEAVKQGLQMF